MSNSKELSELNHELSKALQEAYPKGQIPSILVELMMCCTHITNCQVGLSSKKQKNNSELLAKQLLKKLINQIKKCIDSEQSFHEQSWYPENKSKLEDMLSLAESFKFTDASQVSSLDSDSTSTTSSNSGSLSPRNRLS